MLMNEQILQEKFADLRGQYLEHLGLAIETIETIWAAVLDNPDDFSSLQRLRTAAHKLAGSGSTFGFDAVSEAARSLELVSEELMECGSAAPLRQAMRVNALLKRLKSASSEPMSATIPVPAVSENTDADVGAPVNAVGPHEQKIAPKANANPKILLVDDDLFILRAIRLQLTAYHVDVLEATTGEQAFDVAYRAKPDLIITDYYMPDGSGHHLIRRLKGTVDTQDIPVIVITASRIDGRTDYALRRETLGQYKASDYIEKPLKPDQIVTAIRGHIRLREKSGLPAQPAVLFK